MTLSQARKGSKDALLPEAPPVGYAGLPFAVEPPFDAAGLADKAQQPVKGRVERHLLAARPP